MNPANHSNYEKKLEDLVHRRLRQLPELEAPATLLPRVMAAIVARQQLPWWRRSWTTWPRGTRMGFFVLLMLIALTMLGGGWQAWNTVAASRYGVGLEQFLAPVLSLGQLVVVLAHGLSLTVKTLIMQPVFVAGLIAIGLMYLTCIGLGSACFRLVIHR